MTMGPALRKGVLTAHVTASVGWLGAVAASLVLAAAAMASSDELVVRGAYLLLEPLALYLLVPLSFASLLTGVIQSLGTRWGLFRHYWVVAKLLINVFASIVLLLYLRTLGYLAATASTGDLTSLRNPSPLLHGGVALVLLGLATVLSVFKPKGVTAHGRRRQTTERAAMAQT
jgi:hypothetical protein